MSKVTVLKTQPKTVLQDYAQLLDLATYKKHLSQKHPLLLKLNLSWTKYFPACSTQPWQLEGVLKKIKEDGYQNIIPVENNTVVTDVYQGAKENKWEKLFSYYQTPFQSLMEVEWINYKTKKELFAIPKIFPNGLKIPKFFIGKNIMHLPTMKTHGHTTTTGAMKNAFGGLITKRRHHCHKMIHDVLVDLLTIQKEIHPGIFAVMDGTVAGDGAGPRTMIPRTTNYLLASNDQVAIDALAAKMMGFDPLKIKYIKKAHDLGLGCGDVKQIEIIGTDIKHVNLKFQTQKSPVVLFDQIFRKKIKIIERLLFHTPLFHACIAGSQIYHDTLWYNTVGKARIFKFKRTPWGRLFKHY